MTKQEQAAELDRIAEDQPRGDAEVLRMIAASLRAEPSTEAISIETREVERRFDLNGRARAACDVVHAMDWIHRQPPGDITFLDRINACELLMDGLQNALDGRSTGREFRTLRHSALSRLDPQNNPVVSEADRRCYYCGAVRPEGFSHCCRHRPPSLRARTASPVPLVQKGTDDAKA